MFSEVFELLAIVVALYSLKTSESSFCWLNLTSGSELASFQFASISLPIF